MNLLFILTVLSLPLSFPLTAEGEIYVRASVENPIIRNIETLITGGISFKGITSGSARIVGGEVIFEGAEMLLEMQRARIVVNKDSIKSDRPVEIELFPTGREIVLRNCRLIIGELDINVDDANGELMGVNTVQTRAEEISFSSIERIDLSMKRSDGVLSALWMDGDFYPARSAELRENTLVIEGVDVPSSVDWVILSTRLWIVALMALIISAHLAKKTDYKRDKKLHAPSIIADIVIFILFIYFMNESLRMNFGISLQPRMDTEAIALWLLALLSLTLFFILPSYFAGRSVLRFFRVRDSASSISFGISLIIAIYLILEGEILFLLINTIGKDLVVNLPLYF